MSAAAIRNIAYAGALVTGMLLCGVGAATASADTDAGADDESSYSDVETSSGGETSGNDQSPNDDGPTSTIGNGRNGVVDSNGTPSSDRTASDGSTTGTAATGGSTTIVRSPRKFSPSIRIPLLRLPTAAEFRRPGLTPPTAFITSLEINMSTTLDDVWRAFAEPPDEPEPEPSPSFRTQQEEAPVIDATGNTTGGSDRAAAAEAPPVIRAPVVVAPRAPAPAAPRPAPRGSAPAPPTAPAAAQPAVAGVRTPAIRGSLKASGTVPVTRPLNPATGQTAPAVMPRLLRNPTVGELAIVALPGVGGLLMLTVSGGVIGYRQANSSRYVRTAAVARFLP